MGAGGEESRADAVRREWVPIDKRIILCQIETSPRRGAARACPAASRERVFGTSCYSIPKGHSAGTTTAACKHIQKQYLNHLDNCGACAQPKNAKEKEEAVHCRSLSTRCLRGAPEAPRSAHYKPKPEQVVRNTIMQHGLRPSKSFLCAFCVSVTEITDFGGSYYPAKPACGQFCWLWGPVVWISVYAAASTHIFQD